MFIYCFREHCRITIKLLFNVSFIFLNVYLLIINVFRSPCLLLEKDYMSNFYMKYTQNTILRQRIINLKCIYRYIDINTYMYICYNYNQEELELNINICSL